MLSTARRESSRSTPQDAGRQDASLPILRPVDRCGGNRGGTSSGEGNCGKRGVRRLCRSGDPTGHPFPVHEICKSPDEEGRHGGLGEARPCLPIHSTENSVVKLTGEIG